ncbi:S41 family peptidase [Algoriphagus mannitolivorans]|uniref:S41 family peptidase n=1 Tax=Algoriphagus mannitolivorans TaxID=226504 RepID=UPI000419E2AE|nr:S41 family peptidase [Algoriphagus mannitolivorans]
MSLKSILRLLLIGMITFGAISCKQDEDIEPIEEKDPNIAINNWIKEVMDEVYLWLSEMKTPIANTSEPADYFESLLNRPTDRFSVIYPDYQQLINSLNGIELEAGYEFTLYRESSSNSNVIAEISYIKKGSPAATAGLKRGDIITKINGTQMTLDNYRVVLGTLDKTHTLTFIRYVDANGGFVAQPDVTLTPVQLSENPNFLDSIYTINGEKIGYVVYHFFSPGTGSGSTIYDDQMDAIFQKFKTAGINHLIVDFRYNGGGFVSSAVNLASLIGPGVDNTKVFSKTKYNSYLMQFDQLKNVQTVFKNKSQNLGNTLKNNRVYILTSSRTASASELIINGLRPYMDVFLIGSTTTGKNVGSIPFEDEENPENKYGILPIVSRSFNSLDQSDYINGFGPNLEAKESSERLRPFGDVNELLLRKAIEHITGIPSGARIQKLDRIDVGSTLEHKTRFGNLIDTNPVANEKISELIHKNASER